MIYLLRWTESNTGVARAVKPRQRRGIETLTEKPGAIALATGRDGMNEYKAMLELKEAELAGRLRNRDGIAIEKTADPLDQVQSAEDRELAIRGLDRESTLLRNVRSALDRIERGIYGACLHCEVEISVRRLAAVPWTAYCINCQEASDRREFETGGAFDSSLANAA
jgi:DnaK suppressor protein